MTNKTKQKTKLSRKAPPSKAKKTPFADAGAIVGSKVSTMFNAPWAKGVGRWLGSGIGQIFGSGDYQLLGPATDYNVLTNGNQIPKFSTTHQTNVVCHREYLGDIVGTSAFDLTAYPLNPGMSQTFPWLSTIAQNYQEYRFHGLIFEFRPLITDFVTSGAPGVVIMATNYNADARNYTTKQEMENSEYAASVKPTKDLIHGVECATNQTILSQRYVRTGTVATGQDLRLYDTGTFQFAKQGNPTQLLGELWVSYCVEFFKPILPADVGGNVLSGKITRMLAAPTTPYGTVQLNNYGDLPLTMTTTTLSFPAQLGNLYLVSFVWSGASGAITHPTITTSGGTNQPVYYPFGSAATEARVPASGSTCTIMNYEVVVLATATTISLTSNLGGVFPAASCYLDVFVTQWSTEATF